jgi:hypothetical protein
VTALEAKLKLEWQGEEIARLRNWIADLQSGMFINCVYCGHRYGPDPGTPVAMADVLKAHIEVCPEHPASKLKAALVDAKEALKLVVDLARVALALQNDVRRTNPDTLARRPDTAPTQSPAPGSTDPEKESS